MIARRRQAALVLTALLAAGAACRVDHRTQTAAPAGNPAPTARRAAGPFTLVASGGILPDGSVLDRAKFDADGSGHDFRPMLAGVAPVVSRADLALCHLDTAQGPDGAYTGAPLYKSPPQLAQALAATGYDGCATASAHALDDGADGVRRTLDTLDRTGLRHAGTARGAAEMRGALLPAGGALVACLSYASASNQPLPAGQPWALNPIDADRIVADARAARQAGADVVVVSLDWGRERQDAPDQGQLDLAQRLTAARTGDRPDVDLILGTRTRGPLPYEKVNGTWVAYGLGDQIGGGADAGAADGGAADGDGTDGDGADGDGADGGAAGAGRQDPRARQSTLARFTFAPPARPGGRWEVSRAEFVPEMYDVDAGRVVDVGAAIAGGADLQSVRDAIRTAVLARGADRDGLTMSG
ncbi:CapA family protein [Streptomyces sp. NPDC046985]|uniref:CapA family protein n=1 Tax=Streptomyces sp. NPDC046985 TaxID=3155377 RepID=UPI0034059447